jgi:hypothetical protein
MTNKMKLLIGLLVLGIALIGGGILFILNPFQRNISPVSVQHIEIPEGTPLVTEELNYLMRGENDSLSIYADGSVVYIEEKGLRMPTPGNPATRTWKTGKLTPEELNSLMDYIDNSGFEKLNEYYQFPGKPIEGGTGVVITSGDGSFKFTMNSDRIQKTVTAFGYLTPDHDETYPDMPSPLNEIYRRLRIIAMSTQEVGREIITP